MADELTLHAVWYGLDGSNTKLKGDLGWWPEGTEIAKVEERMWEGVPEAVHTVSLYVERKDGSGWRGHYKRSGKAWVRVHSDSMLPQWFPWLGCGMVIAMIVGLAVMGLILEH